MPRDHDRVIAEYDLFYMTYYSEENLDERHGQLRAIGKHLTNHTYHHRSMTSGQRGTYDVDKFRALAGEVFTRHYKNSATGSVDRPTSFFRLKSQGLLNTLLKDEGFDPSTFAVSNLPPPSYSAEERKQLEEQLAHGFGTPKSEREWHLQRSVCFVLHDIEAVKQQCTYLDYKYGNRDRQLHALRLLIRQYSLMATEPDGSAKLLSPERLRKSIHEHFRIHHTHRGHKRSTAIVYHTGKKGLKPGWMKVVEHNSELLTEKDGLPSYEAQNAIWSFESVSTHLSSYEATDEGLIGHTRNEYDTTSQAKSPATIDGGSFSPSPSVHPERSLKRRKRAEPPNNNPGASSSSKNVGRSLSTVETATSAKAVGTNTWTNESPDYLWNEISVASSIPPGPLPDVSRETLGWSTSTTSVATDNESPSAFVPQSPHLDLGEIKQDMNRLYHAVNDAIKSTCENLDLDENLQNLQSPLHQCPDEQLRSLYERCWSTEWPDIWPKLIGGRAIIVPDVLVALVSSFLYNRIFLKGNLWLSSLAQSFNIGILTSQLQAVLRRQHDASETILASVPHLVLGLAANDGVERHSAPSAAAKELLFNLVSIKDFNAWATEYASNLSHELCNFLEPHVNKLIRIADEYPLKTRGVRTSWQADIIPTLQQLFQGALTLKTKLQSFEYAYTFLWPEHAEQLDGTMNPKYEVLPSLQPFHQVAFTLFPGIVVNGDLLREADVVSLDRRAGFGN